MMRYAVLGTGAVGGFYGARLQRAGAEVHFLARSDFEDIRRFGLRVDSPAGNFRLEKVSVHRDSAYLPACDVAIVAWKTTDNAALREVLPRAVRPGGIVLVLQNGLDPERDAIGLVKDAAIVSGLCFLCARKEGPGWIRHLDYGAVTFAAYGPGGGQALGVTPEMRALERDFGQAGLETRLHVDWREARWRKLVWNIPFNGLCALMRADTAKLLKEPTTRARVRSLMEETMAGAAACGSELPGDFAERMLRDTDAMRPYDPSMKLDREAGRPMELEAIYGRTLAAIREAGASAPGIVELHAELQAL